jgi:SAM-dependent methyltransferase
MQGHVDFDDYADDYDRTLNRGLAFSGEDKDYFARERMTWVRGVLNGLGVRPRRAIDFGCGTGASVRLLLDVLGAESALGIDVSSRSIEIARQTCGSARASFLTFAEHVPDGSADFGFCNGVFHHIPPAERADAVRHVWRSLGSGGLWAFWENNPYNPGTQWLMHRLPFDRGVKKLSARRARRLLAAEGFEILRTDHLFLFPKFLSPLRAFERHLTKIPAGAQYLIVARKSEQHA